MEYTLSLALILGLFSTLHCIGMCGGIIGALSYAAAASGRSLSQMVFAYNAGRITSYTLAGALIALAAAWLSQLWLLRLLLQLAATLLILLIGLHIGGWFPRLAMLERLGLPIWHHLAPLAHALHPIQRLRTAFLYGVVWGWLPCGLVYSVLLTAMALDSPTQGALYLLAFGLGTLPAMAVTGIFAGTLQHLTRHPAVRRGVAISIILLGLLSLWYAIPDLLDTIPYGGK